MGPYFAADSGTDTRTNSKAYIRTDDAAYSTSNAWSHFAADGRTDDVTYSTPNS